MTGVQTCALPIFGGETSEKGAARFTEVLCHRPDIIIIDYGLNDRCIGLAAAERAWSKMIEEALVKDIKLLLCTPTPDITVRNSQESELNQHSEQIRQLTQNYGIGLVDSFKVICDTAVGADISDLLSWTNHPNRWGHELVAKEILKWFPFA